MKKLILTIIALALSLCNFLAQDMNLYKTEVSIADSLFELENYKEASKHYVKAFESIDGKAYPQDRYQLATAYTLQKNYDDALYHLHYLADKSIQYLDIEDIKRDSNLLVLHTDDRWKTFVQKLDDYITDLQKDYNWDLVKLLDEIYDKDQGIRKELKVLQSQYAFDSEPMKLFLKRWRQVDSLNEIMVTKILDEHGWLGKEIVSPRGNSALFLVIQHAPLETQLKYLPMMREAVEKGNANASSLALLEDRTNLRQGKKQIYGSQISTGPDGMQYVMPLEDPIHVNERRKSVGLGTLEDYVSRWGIKWDAEEYIKKLPEYEALQKQQNQH